MKRIMFILICCSLLNGCFYQKVNHAEIEKAKQFCGDNGIDYIREDFLGIETTIYCLDGSNIIDHLVELKGVSK